MPNSWNFFNNIIEDFWYEIFFIKLLQKEVLHVTCEG